MTTESATRKAYINEMYTILDEKVAEAFEEGNDIGIISASEMATYMRKNERAVRRNGFPSHFDAKQKGCEWERYKGLKIDLEKYIMDRDTLSKNDKRDIEVEPEEKN